MNMTTKSNNNNALTTKEKSPLRQALPQILAVCVKNVLLLAFGMTQGYPTILIPSLSGTNSDYQLTQEQVSWIGSINMICVPIGALFSGAFTQILGRKRTMQLVNIPFLAAWLMFNFSTSIWQVFLALSITGLSGGLLEAPVLTYVAEITQPHLRGMLSSTSTMSVIMGITIQFFLGTFFPWRHVALINVIVPVTAFTLLFFVPESPHWLIMKNRYDEARESIAWLRGWTTVEEIEPEFQELCRHQNKFSDGMENPAFESKLDLMGYLKSKKETLKLFTKRTFIVPYCLVSFVFFVGHFNGMTTLQTYAVQIFAAFETPIDKYYATITLGCAELIGCIACVSLIHCTGKRMLTFTSMLLSGICFLIVATYAHCNEVTSLVAGTKASNETGSAGEVEFGSTWNWVPPAFLIGAAFCSHFGIRILPWILTGEVFTNDTRAAASGFSSSISYVFGFLANKCFFSMIYALTLPGTFWFYAATSFLGIIILFFWLPETEGKSLHEITEHFAGITKLDKSVHRRRSDRLKGKSNKAFEDLEKIRAESLKFESKL